MIRETLLQGPVRHALEALAEPVAADTELPPTDRATGLHPA
jgi:hypothetical protein